MKRAALTILLASLFVLAGCQGGEQQDQPDLTEPYIGGVQGLAVSFAEGMPPAEVYDDGQTTFSVGVLLENVGESSVGINTLNQYGYVELIGINPTQFGKTPGDLRTYFDETGLELQKARRGYEGSVLTGDTALVEFPDLNYQPDRYGNTEATIRANVCYEYHTFTDTEICFKDNVLENAADDTICTLSGAKQVSGSGGPVQVTQLTQNPAGSDRIHVTFTVENLGGGAVFAPWSWQTQVGNAFGDDACEFNAGANPNRDVVHVDVSLGSESIQDIRCPLLGGGNTGIVRMYQGSPATVTCTINTLGQEGSRIFTDSLHVDLWYTYLDWVETPVLVRDTNAGFAERGLDQEGRR